MGVDVPKDWIDNCQTTALYDHMATSLFICDFFGPFSHLHSSVIVCGCVMQ